MLLSLASELRFNEMVRDGLWGGGGGAHLHSRTDWCEWIHLWEADGLAVHGLLDHDGGAGLALGPRRRGGVARFGLIQQHITQVKYEGGGSKLLLTKGGTDLGVEPGFELIRIWVES